MNLTFNFGKYIILRETLVYIEPTSGSRHYNENSCAELMYFVSYNNIPSVMLSPCNSIEPCIVYAIDMNCKTYKPSA